MKQDIGDALSREPSDCDGIDARELDDDLIVHAQIPQPTPRENVMNAKNM